MNATQGRNPEFEDLLAFIRDERGFDFTGYKRPSLMRRITRRMQDVKVESYALYRSYLEHHPDEFGRLFDTILINVTSFFRDTAAWQFVREEVVPRIVEGTAPNDPIRVWGTGCSTGEEAYTTAMVFAEVMGEEDFKRRVKIYATDVDNEALGIGRHASYSHQHLEPVPPELREKYFEEVNSSYAFRSDLRRCVIFGNEIRYLDVQIHPLTSVTGELLGVAVSFADVTRYRRLQEALQESKRDAETAYEELQSTVEELETTNEELQSTNEELETTNEELQSTNEELETMNEELQSTNEELETINDELQQRTDELNSVNSFLEGVLGSLSSAVVVLDPELRVEAWNDAARDLWGLRSDEVNGQHFLNLDIGRPLEPLRTPIRSVLAGEAPDPFLIAAVNRRGRPIDVSIRVAPLSSANHDVLGVIMMMDAASSAAADGA